jgi:membrane protein
VGKTPFGWSPNVTRRLQLVWQRGYRPSRRLWDTIMGDDITTSSSSFAYHAMFAIPALLILSVAIAAFINQATSIDVTGTLRELIHDHAPVETRELLNTLVDNAIARVGSGGASLGIAITTVVALWSGSSAVATLLNAFNRAYGVVETRPFVQRTRLKLVLTLLGTLTVNAAFVLIVFGHRIGEHLADELGLGARFDYLWGVLRVPAAVFLIALLLAVLYYLGPNVELSFRWISPGSVLATILWLLASAAFGTYLRVIQPGSAYGALGGVVVLLFFLYVTGFIFLLGAKLNAEIGKRFDPLTIEDLATGGSARARARASARRRLRRWLAGSAVRRRVSIADSSAVSAADADHDETGQM